MFRSKLQLKNAIQIVRNNSSTSAANTVQKIRLSEESLANNPLTDTFGRHHTYLRISLTEKCNLRCTHSIYHRNDHSHLNKSINRFYSLHLEKKLTHVDDEGKASMVDVTEKNTTTRKATARAEVNIGHELTNIIKENRIKKGDVLSIAQIAGIIGAKKTSEIIPLCHNIPLTGIKVTAHLDEIKKSVIINATVQCQGKTGVEMEAMTAVSIAALTVYDMCKAVSRNITITNIELLEKSGGSRGNYTKQEIFVRGYETSPIVDDKVVFNNV